MGNDILNEVFFWKHLADALLENSRIDKKLFYKRVETVKSVWDIGDIDKISKEIAKAAKDKRGYLKENFMKIITDLEKNRSQVRNN
ncbi:hypothetical protein KY347_04370 [Candidatus Woesearchaeota archaeon]|nr:hypothetical protein [Candidatus Woesearchaeota archaeon]